MGAKIERSWRICLATVHYFILTQIQNSNISANTDTNTSTNTNTDTDTRKKKKTYYTNTSVNGSKLWRFTFLFLVA